MTWAIWVTGGLDYTDGHKVWDQLEAFPKGSTVMTGIARGADTLADTAASSLGHFVVRVPYHGYAGKAGGPMRNTVLAHLLQGLKLQGYDTVVLAFGGDRGTDDSVAKAKRLGLLVKEFDR